MREPTIINALRARLSKIGCPARHARQFVQEVSEHREDLFQDALEVGMTAEAADAFADEKLGDIETLVLQFAAVLRRRSWWGRHPVLTFCVLPPIAIFAWFFGVIVLVAWGTHLFGMAESLTRRIETGLALSRAIVYSIHYTAVVLVPALLCWLARGYAHDFKWALAGCALCSVHGLFHVLTLTSHNLGWGYGFHPDWFAVVAPWLIYGAYRYFVGAESRRCEAQQRIEETI
jgi:hypothetical protein